MIVILLASVMLTACGGEDYTFPSESDYDFWLTVSAFGKTYFSDELISKVEFQPWGEDNGCYLNLAAIKGFEQFYAQPSALISSLDQAITAYFPRIDGMPVVGMTTFNPNAHFWEMYANCDPNLDGWHLPEARYLTLRSSAEIVNAEGFELNIKYTEDVIYVEMTSKDGSILSYRVDRSMFDQIVNNGLPENGNQDNLGQTEVDQQALAEKILGDVLGMSQSGGMEVMNFTFIAQDQYGRDQISAWMRGVAATLTALYPGYEIALLGWDSVGTTYVSTIDLSSETFFRAGGFRSRGSYGYSNFEYHSDQQTTTDLLIGGALYLVPIS